MALFEDFSLLSESDIILRIRIEKRENPNARWLISTETITEDRHAVQVSREWHQINQGDEHLVLSDLGYKGLRIIDTYDLTKRPSYASN